MEKLTKENYITNHNYLSYSTLSNFMKCEASVMAGYREPSTIAQLVGSYVDAYFSNELEEFKEAHLEIFKKDGTLKSDFSDADKVIKRVEEDEEFTRLMSGEKQVIMTGEISGTPFKIKMDSYKPGEFIVDLKVMKSLDKVWSDAFGSYVNFILAYNYDIEMAIFQEVVRQNTGQLLPTYIAAVTKEEGNNIGLYEIDQETLDNSLELVKKYIERYKEVKSGKDTAQRCENCSYCRKTRKGRILNFKYAGLNGDRLREEGIEYEEIKLEKKEE